MSFFVFERERRYLFIFHDGWRRNAQKTKRRIIPIDKCKKERPQNAKYQLFLGALPKVG